MKLANNFTIFFVFVLLASTVSSSTGPWATFLHLAGSRLGDAGPAVPALKKYLHRFGYLSSSSSSNFTDAFDDDLVSALRIYQQNFNLDVTGSVDLPTIKQLVSPRCGVPDIINGTSSMSSGKFSGRHLFEFFPGTPTWPRSKRQLTYAIVSTSTVSVPPSAIRAVFARAFGRWAAVTTLSFKEVTPESEADISVGFYNGDHGDGEAFDGALQTLAHAFSPTNGRFHLDAAEEWVAEGDVAAAGSGGAVDLESVVVHEIGHLLGLGHSSAEEAIMYPSIRTRTRKVELARDDVAGVQMLYGSNPNYVGVAPESATARKQAEMGSNNADGGVRMVIRGLALAGIIIIMLVL